MNEPNDTAQEGFDQLKRNLEVRYPEDSDLSLDEFLNVESLLALAVRVCGPGADPRKADRLLSNYQLIRPETIGADGHLMQMARRHLFSLASSTAWRRLLGLYERAEYERYRFFDIANGGMALREHPLTGIDRMPIYMDRLLGDVKLSHKNVVARPKGRYSYTCKPEATGDTTVTGSIRWVTIPDAVPPQTGKIDDIPRKSRRPPIDITLDELISTADEVGEKTGKTHYAAGLRLDEVVSLVGLVGAGKSVLANMLIVCLAKRGLRAVSLLNSVSDVMESVVLLREAGISASPLVSRGRRIERLDERQEVVVRVAHFEREAPVGEILVTVKKAVDAFAGGEADFALKQFDGVGGQCVVVIEIGSNQQLRGRASPSRPASRPEIVVRRLSVRRPACPRCKIRPGTAGRRTGNRRCGGGKPRASPRRKDRAT